MAKRKRPRISVDERKSSAEILDGVITILKGVAARVAEPNLIAAISLLEAAAYTVNLQAQPAQDETT